jgi:hypothetical protein
MQERSMQERSMTTRIIKAVVQGACLLLVLQLALRSTQAQETKSKYPTMAPLEGYLMADRDAEIALARSAAPPALSRDAEVLVLGKDGYHTAIEGKNGFTCVVERGWMSPLDSPDFWNPRLRGPICYNPAAVRSILPYTILRTELILSGLTKAQMADNILAAVASRKMPPARSWSDVVYVVKGPISGRRRRALASSSDVSRGENRGRELGRKRG